jgi:hypothetical protein
MMFFSCETLSPSLIWLIHLSCAVQYHISIPASVKGRADGFPGGPLVECVPKGQNTEQPPLSTALYLLLMSTSFSSLFRRIVSSNVVVFVPIYCWTTLFTEHVGGPTMVRMCLCGVCVRVCVRTHFSFSGCTRLLPPILVLWPLDEAYARGQWRCGAERAPVIAVGQSTKVLWGGGYGEV